MKIKLVATLSLLLAYMGMASASTITFNEAGAFGSNFLSSDGLIKAEWVWSTGLNDGHNHLGIGPDGLAEFGHGQQYQGIRFSSTTSSLVSLVSFDLIGSWKVGVLNNGTGTLYSSPSAWTTQLASLTAQTIYIYADNTNSAGLDNVVINATSAVPEPATLALMGLGFIGMVARRRKSV